MQIVELVLKGYKRLFLSHINKIVYNPTNKINLILGTNGGGKSSLMKELSPLPADMKEFEEDGYKEITIIHNGDKYYLTSGVVATNKHSFMHNGLELNPAGTKKVQLNLVKEHFNLTPDIHTVMLGLKGFTSMSAMERKNWLTNISTVDYTYAINIYNKLKQRNRDIIGAIKISQSELSKNTSLIINEEDKKLILEDISKIKEVIKLLLESKTLNKDIRSIDMDFINTTITSAYRLLEIANKTYNRTFEVNPKNLDKLIYNITNTLPIYEEKIKTLAKTLEELEYLEKTVSFDNDGLDSIINKIKERLKKIDDSLYLDINVNKIMEFKIIFEHTYSKIYETLLIIVENTIDEYTIDNYKKDVNTISDLKSDIVRNTNIINKLELEKANMEHSRDHNSVECNKCGNIWSIGFNEKDYKYTVNKINDFIEKNNTIDKTILDMKNITDIFEKKLDAINVIRNMISDKNLELIQPVFKYINNNANILNNPNKAIDILNNINNDLNSWIEYPYIMEELNETLVLKKTSDEKIAIELKHHNSNKLKIEEEYFDIKKKIYDDTKYLEHLKDYKNILNKMREIFNILIKFIQTSNGNTDCEVENSRNILINETITVLDMEVSKLENKLNESLYNERLIADNKNKVIELNKRKEATDILIDAMSPSNGLIGKSITNFLNVFTKDMNEIINSIWNYNIEILPCKITDTNDLDYKFEVLVDNRNVIEDVSKTSSSMQEIIDLAFKIVSMKYLKMENGYLLLDEFGRTFDTVHAKNAYDIIDILANSSFSNVFIISHFEGTYGRFKNADISVLNNENLLLNKDLEINKVMQIS